MRTTACGPTCRHWAWEHINLTGDLQLAAEQASRTGRLPPPTAARSALAHDFFPFHEVTPDRAKQRPFDYPYVSGVLESIAADFDGMTEWWAAESEVKKGWSENLSKSAGNNSLILGSLAPSTWL